MMLAFVRGEVKINSYGNIVFVFEKGENKRYFTMSFSFPKVKARN